MDNNNQLKNIIITQRVMYMHDIREFRDALDTRWTRLLAVCGYMPIIIPNAPALVDIYLSKFDYAGIILTGGNNLGETPERDETETALLKYAIEKNIPLLGVCRGMQVIQHYCGIELTMIKGHIWRNHIIKYGKDEFEVNSTHNFGTTQEAKELETLGVSKEDGCIEAIRYKGKNIYGMMWQPEREDPFVDRDLDFIKSVFGKK